jgi:hypothetical protein
MANLVLVAAKAKAMAIAALVQTPCLAARLNEETSQVTQRGVPRNHHVAPGSKVGGWQQVAIVRKSGPIEFYQTIDSNRHQQDL